MGIDLLSVMSGLSGAGQGILAAQDRKVALDRQAKLDAMAQAELQTKQANFNSELALKKQQIASEDEYRRGLLKNNADKIAANATVQNRKLEIESNKVANKTYMSNLGLTHARDKIELENLKKTIKDTEEAVKNEANTNKLREMNSRLEESKATMGQLEAKVQEGELTLKAYDTAYMSNPAASPLEFSLSAQNYLKDVQVGNSKAILGADPFNAKTTTNVTDKLLKENIKSKTTEDPKPMGVVETKDDPNALWGINESKNYIDEQVDKRGIVASPFSGTKADILKRTQEYLAKGDFKKLSSKDPVPAKDFQAAFDSAVTELLDTNKLKKSFKTKTYLVPSGGVPDYGSGGSREDVPLWDRLKESFQGY
jgi:hypothetical protein